MPSEFVMYLRTSAGSYTLTDLNKRATIADLINCVKSVTHMSISRMSLFVGDPPEPIDLRFRQDRLMDHGLRSGCILILHDLAKNYDEPALPPPIDNETKLQRALQDSDQTQQEQSSEPTFASNVLKRHSVPADNSCLFYSVQFVLNGVLDGRGSAPMRRIVADQLAMNAEQYSDVVLGMPLDKYREWIQKHDSWGGAIELAVLSKYYGLEIVVLDTSCANISRFGEDQHYDWRVFLVYDGAHYDPVYMLDMVTHTPVTQFSVADEDIFAEAHQIAKGKCQKKRCKVCNALLMGPLDAKRHWEKTGHSREWMHVASSSSS